MAPARKRSPVAATISQPILSQVSSTLQSLPEKPKEFWSLREAITQLQEPITIALDRGYSYEEIAQLLAEHDMPISVSSLKRYLSMSRPKSDAPTTKGRRRGKRRGSQSASEASEDDGAAAEMASAPEVTESPEAPEEPTPKRRRSTNKSETEAQEKPRSTARGRSSTRSAQTSTTRRRKRTT